MSASYIPGLVNFLVDLLNQGVWKTIANKLVNITLGGVNTTLDPLSLGNEAYASGGGGCHRVDKPCDDVRSFRQSTTSS